MGENVKIMGADQSPNNISAGHYVSTLQATTKRSRLYKVSYTNLSGADIYLWVFDLAAGTIASVAPVMVRRCPATDADTWDFYSGGSIFQNGIFIAVSTTAPTDATTAPADAGNDAAIVRAEVRAG